MKLPLTSRANEFLCLGQMLRLTLGSYHLALLKIVNCLSVNLAKGYLIAADAQTENENLRQEV